MTIVRGIYCDRCRVRYVYHACKYGMPCEHHVAEIARDGISIIAPATLIGCFSWRYAEGFRVFELQELYYVYDKKKNRFLKKWDEKRHFEARYVTEDELVDQFLKFLKEKLPVIEWPPFVEAFRSLLAGGRSLTYPPRWRMKQLARKYAVKVDKKNA